MKKLFDKFVDWFLGDIGNVCDQRGCDHCPLLYDMCGGHNVSQSPS